MKKLLIGMLMVIFIVGWFPCQINAKVIENREALVYKISPEVDITEIWTKVNLKENFKLRLAGYFNYGILDFSLTPESVKLTAKRRIEDWLMRSEHTKEIDIPPGDYWISWVVEMDKYNNEYSTLEIKKNGANFFQDMTCFLQKGNSFQKLAMVLNPKTLDWEGKGIFPIWGWNEKEKTWEIIAPLNLSKIAQRDFGKIGEEIPKKGLRWFGNDMYKGIFCTFYHSGKTCLDVLEKVTEARPENYFDEYPTDTLKKNGDVIDINREKQKMLQTISNSYCFFEYIGHHAPRRGAYQNLYPVIYLVSGSEEGARDKIDLKNEENSELNVDVDLVTPGDIRQQMRQRSPFRFVILLGCASLVEDRNPDEFGEALTHNFAYNSTPWRGLHSVVVGTNQPVGFRGNTPPGHPWRHVFKQNFFEKAFLEAENSATIAEILERTKSIKSGEPQIEEIDAPNLYGTDQSFWKIKGDATLTKGELLAPIKRGDVNQDGIIGNEDDLQLLQNILEDLKLPFRENYPPTFGGDCNGDGKISNMDLFLLKHFRSCQKPLKYR